MKTDLLTKLLDQQKDVLQKMQKIESKESKKKYMELFKKLDGTAKTVKLEIAELNQNISKLQKGVEAGKADSTIRGVRVSEGSKVFRQAATSKELNGKDDAEASDAGSKLPRTPNSLVNSANKKKLFRVVQVTGCPVELQEELIVHMEKFGELFDFDITRRQGPCLFTFKQPMDAQKVHI